jgi:hypothetical protein
LSRRDSPRIVALRLRYAPPRLQGLLELDAVPARFEQLRARLDEMEAPDRPSGAVPAFRELDPGRN